MKIKKGTRLLIDSSRKGKYKAIAQRDFNTTEEWYPVIVDQDIVCDASTDWVKGEEIPCRKGLCKISKIT